MEGTPRLSCSSFLTRRTTSSVASTHRQELNLLEKTLIRNRIIDNFDNLQELPTALLDLLEASCSDLFYSGCVIVEVRDLRRRPPLPPSVVGQAASAAQQSPSYDASANSSFVLLRPTTQSLICDSNLLVARAAEQLQKVLNRNKSTR